ncbi:MAG TPA: hypothetical protein VLN44_00160 [Pyrinomonadaceae bacterium]|nr:hypothetical protein [Pyrinomonadaceae bacterium]
MNVEITDEEREFLDELFEEKQKHMIQEINHTDTIDFERLLRKKNWSARRTNAKDRTGCAVT